MGLGQWPCGRSDGLSFNEEDFHCGSIMQIVFCKYSVSIFYINGLKSDGVVFQVKHIYLNGQK